MTAVLQKRGDPKRALAAAYLLRIYITLDIMGYSVSLPVIAAGFDALEWYAVILVAGATATTIVSALSGRLTLLAGRRRAMLVSVLGTAGCSVFCAFSGSLPLFLAGYFCKNLFAGVATTMPVGILADSTSREERPRYMSLYSVMNNMGNLLGPLLGGLVTDRFGFWLTPLYPLPLAAWAVAMLLRYYRQPAGEAVRHEAFDFSGGAMLIGGVGSLVVFLNLGGQRLSWRSPVLWGLALLFLLCLGLFLRHGRRQENAVIPLSLFRVRSFAVANLLIPLIIPQMTLSNNFALLLVQVGMGRSAASSATYAIPKTLAIILASLLLGKWIIRHPIWQKRFVLISGGLIGGVELLMGLTGSWEAFPALLYGFTFLLGLGEALYYMTLYALYQRDLSPAQMPTGISAQFLLASLSTSLCSSIYGVLLTAWGGDIMAAYPVMCYVTLIPTTLYLVIAASCRSVFGGREHEPPPAS
jgi:MFS family permease